MARPGLGSTKMQIRKQPGPWPAALMGFLARTGLSLDFLRRALLDWPGLTDARYTREATTPMPARTRELVLVMYPNLRS
jgi:hypothetical protein